MAQTQTYPPRGDAAFDLFFKNLIQYVSQQCTGSTPRWTHIPAAARTAIGDVYAAWYTAYAVTFKPCTRPETAEKNRQHKLAEKALRNFVNIYLRYHPDVTDDDKRNMGIPVSDGTRTPAVPPKEGPSYTVVQLGPRILGISYWFAAGRRSFGALRPQPRCPVTRNRHTPRPMTKTPEAPKLHAESRKAAFSPCPAGREWLYLKTTGGSA
jgi:hypothetical protein